MGDIGDASYKITFVENNLQIGTHGTNRDTWDKEAHILLRPYNSYIIYILCSLNVNFYMKEELLWVRVPDSGKTFVSHRTFLATSGRSLVARSFSLMPSHVSRLGENNEPLGLLLSSTCHIYYCCDCHILSHVIITKICHILSQKMNHRISSCRRPVTYCPILLS